MLLYVNVQFRQSLLSEELIYCTLQAVLGKVELVLADENRY